MCAVAMIGEVGCAAVNAGEGPYVGPGSKAGIIVKTAPLNGDFIDDTPSVDE